MANANGDAPDVGKAIENFKVDEVLDVNPRLKYAALSGKIAGTDNIAVAVLHKDGFDADKLQLLFKKDADWDAFLSNDIYGGFTVKNPPPELSSIKATFIYPATEKHVQKYRKQDFFLVVETAELYETVVRPHFESMKFSLQWVYNILEHKKESERIAFEDPDDSTGFVLLPDLKWSGEKTEELYLVAIIRRRDLGSLRDLRGEHIPLLKNILEKGTGAIKKTYGVPASKLKVYVHYHPTYQHFHVHFIHLSQEGYGSGIERGHPLSTIISNLTIDPLYYTKVDLPITVRDNDPLKKLFEERGVTVD